MIDLTGRTDVPVAEEVLTELAGICHGLELEFLVVGAAARRVLERVHGRAQALSIQGT